MDKPPLKTAQFSRADLLARLYGKQTGTSGRAILTVVEGPDKGKSFRINSWETTIGRGQANNVPLSDSTVSTEHAKVRFFTKGYVIFDLNSRNGTYVNGKIIEHGLVRNGAEIQVGRTRLRFDDPEHRSG